MNQPQSTESLPTNLCDLMLAERHRTIRDVARGLIFVMQLDEVPVLALRLNPMPSKNTLEAVSTFVNERSCAMSNTEIIRGFDTLKDCLQGRIADLFNRIDETD